MILSRRPEVERFLAAPPAGMRAVVIHGRDRSGVRERADQLAAQATARPDDPFDTALLAEAELEGSGRLQDELSALSLMGGRRLVRVRLGEKVAPERAAAEALVQHVEGAFNPDAFLLIEAGALDRSSPLRKAAEQAKAGAACIAVYDDEAGDIAGLARSALAADRVGLTPDALELFVARLPKERGVARQEIERLILFLGPGSRAMASPGDLSTFFGVEPEASLGDAASEAFGGRGADVYASVRRANAEGDGGVPVVRAMAQHLGRLRRAGALMSAGASAGEAAKASGVFWKAEREFIRQLSAWRAAELDIVQVDIVEADRACKQAGAPDVIIAERLSLAVAARARRLGL